MKKINIVVGLIGVISTISLINSFRDKNRDKIIDLEEKIRMAREHLVYLERLQDLDKNISKEQFKVTELELEEIRDEIASLYEHMEALSNQVTGR
ncbi:TPA: hypothetical protein TUL06_000472 [Streptococcus equi subsp. zooepidemicus]|nr:hypothetical protein [Streptococcus equi subsp. zooepidemicus]HEL0011297.1 hypothetical protein [Streptococcus equi subsp. zooepidemicus]HEL0013367.1 hypothetical protein [Streptococcus equi subsp. zooepidemicus]HEL0017475.1 hypothetical protein [Streptococcus equi subsp. zooepidemicus]HEL0029331.1 hypothetical protein [Streptococcus equi subsp. zooepidemicus]